MANKAYYGTLGDVIRDARIAADLSLREIAKKLTITPSYISDIENDRRVPSEEVLRQIAKLLNLDFDELMARAGRFGEHAQRYLRRNPTAGVLFRRISDASLHEEDLKKLLQKAEQLSRKREKDEST